MGGTRHADGVAAEQRAVNWLQAHLITMMYMYERFIRVIRFIRVTVLGLLGLRGVRVELGLGLLNRVRIRVTN